MGFVVPLFAIYTFVYRCWEADLAIAKSRCGSYMTWRKNDWAVSAKQQEISTDAFKMKSRVLHKMFYMMF